MMQGGKILVPVDLSPRSIGAARYAASLGKALGSRLVFVHALKNGWPLGAAEREVRDEILKVPEERPKFLVREGAPVAAILNAAGAEEVDLILMPTRGAQALSLALGRSITARVLHAARCPVWAGLDDLSPLSLRPIRNILCGLSLGPRAGSVLRWAASLATRLEATLAVIYASRELESSPGYPCDQEWKFWLKKMARDDIRALQAGAGTNAEVWLEAGSPLAAVPPIAERLQADLLVIGKSPPRRFLGNLRTLSYGLVCKAPCPVASV